MNWIQVGGGAGLCNLIKKKQKFKFKNIFFIIFYRLELVYNQNFMVNQINEWSSTVRLQNFKDFHRNLKRMIESWKKEKNKKLTKKLFLQCILICILYKKKL